MGRVTRTSTCSGVSPTASVWRKFREYIIFGAAKCVDPIGNQNAGERGDNAAEANCQSNDRSLWTRG
jgi:hypothetical protein